MAKRHRSETVATNKLNPTQKMHEQRERCHHLSRHNLWELFLFLLVSICAYNVRDISLFGLASEPLRQILGSPPPAFLISVALAVYFFSSVVLGLAALVNRVAPLRTWNHLGYRSAFYFFYSFSGAIGEHFIPVLLAGLILYGLDQCQLRQYSHKLIHGYDSMTDNV